MLHRVERLRSVGHSLPGGVYRRAKKLTGESTYDKGADQRSTVPPVSGVSMLKVPFAFRAR